MGQKYELSLDQTVSSSDLVAGLGKTEQKWRAQPSAGLLALVCRQLHNSSLAPPALVLSNIWQDWPNQTSALPALSYANKMLFHQPEDRTKIMKLDCLCL